VYQHAQLVGWDGISLIFCLGWSLTMILLISTFQVAEITGMSHLTWLKCSFLILSNSRISVSVFFLNNSLLVFFILWDIHIFLQFLRHCFLLGPWICL
jgi:hypothetical protein